MINVLSNKLTFKNNTEKKKKEMVVYFLIFLF